MTFGQAGPEIRGEYELKTGKVIVETFLARGMAPAPITDRVNSADFVENRHTGSQNAIPYDGFKFLSE